MVWWNLPNKILVNIIKKFLQENNKSWHNKLVNALWADMLTTKKSIGMYPYQLVYGIDAIFPTSFGICVLKMLQELEVEPNDLPTRINQTIHLQQLRDEVHNRTWLIQESIKKKFDRRTKADDCQINNHVLKWDSRREEKCKHGKFDNLCMRPYIIHAYRGNYAFLLKDMDGT